MTIDALMECFFFSLWREEDVPEVKGGGSSAETKIVVPVKGRNNHQVYLTKMQVTMTSRPH